LKSLTKHITDIESKVSTITAKYQELKASNEKYEAAEKARLEAERLAKIAAEKKKKEEEAAKKKKEEEEKAAEEAKEEEKKESLT
jgi:hypothetical protein